MYSSFASVYDVVMRGYERYIKERKRRLFAELPKSVVEIGAGTGANLRFLPSFRKWTNTSPWDSMKMRGIVYATF